MKPKFTLFTVCMALSMLCFGQEPLNQLDKDGKKDGKWIIYLNANWEKVKDSSKAVFYRYNFFDHGANLNPMGPCGGKGWKLESKPYGDQHIGKIKQLDGEYKWFDPKGRLIFDHVLKNGEYVSYKEYYRSGVLRTAFDYTRLYKEQPHSSWYGVYDKKGNIKFDGYFFKDEKGHWPPSRD